MNILHYLLIRGDKMEMEIIDRGTSFYEIDLEFKKRDIPLSDKIKDLIKDIFIDNPEAVLSYKGVYIEGYQGELFFKDTEKEEFIIHGSLSESDEDNLKIHGVGGFYDGSNFIVEEPRNIESSTITNFERTHFF